MRMPVFFPWFIVTAEFLLQIDKIYDNVLLSYQLHKDTAMPSGYETAALSHTKDVCRQRFRQTTDFLEKRAMAYYRIQLSKITPVDDAQRFKKPFIGAGGYGDQEITKNIVARDPEDHRPILDSDGRLKLVEYRFKNLETYLRSIECFKNPDYLDGVKKVRLTREELLKEQQEQLRLQELFKSSAAHDPDFD